MFKVGDLIIYSAHGICRVDDISDISFSGETKSYFVLHPIENHQELTINVPFEKGKKAMHKLMNKEEAEEVLTIFHTEDCFDWIDKVHVRHKTFNDLVSAGERLEIAKLANTLMRKKSEVQLTGRKFYEQDNKLLVSIQRILFKEIALALDTTYEEISKKVKLIIKKNTKVTN